MDMARRPTLRDVAREAQLSVTQASRALNEHDDVAPATVERAKAAALKLGYTPNLEARRLRDPDTSSHAIGLILSNETLHFSDPFFGNLLTGIVAEAGQRRYELQLSTNVSDVDPAAAYQPAIRHKKVDGFILLRTELNDSRISYLVEAGFPFVAFGRSEDADGFPAVEPAPDCMTTAVQHLAELGHKRIACLAEPAQFNIGAARLRSFTNAVEAAQVQSTVLEAGFHQEDGYETTKALLQRDGLSPTAIVALNDQLALGALHAAAELNVEVPTQLSILGFDDIDAAQLVRPSLTTMHQSATEVGASLVGLLIEAIGSDAPYGETVEISCQLVIRDSTGPANSEVVVGQ